MKPKLKDIELEGNLHRKRIVFHFSQEKNHSISFDMNTQITAIPAMLRKAAKHLEAEIKKDETT